MSVNMYSGYPQLAFNFSKNLLLHARLLLYNSTADWAENSQLGRLFAIAY